MFLIAKHLLKHGTYLFLGILFEHLARFHCRFDFAIRFHVTALQSLKVPILVTSIRLLIFCPWPIERRLVIVISHNLAIQQQSGGGKVKEVSRETEAIVGKFKFGALTQYVFINLRISRTSEGTELRIQTQRKEGLLTEGGSQKGLAACLATLGSGPRLAQGTTGGW